MLEAKGRAAGRQEDIARIESIFARETSASQSVRLAVQLFGHPESSVMKELLSRLPYLDLRSGTRLNFYFMGFCDPLSAATFSASEFTAAIEELEKITSWRYSGGTDVIVHNCTPVPGSPSVLDYSRVIVLTLEAAIQDKVVRDVAQFCENLMQFTRIYTGPDPTWGFSDAQGKGLLGSALKQLALRAMPESLRQDASKALHVRVQDVALAKQA